MQIAKGMVKTPMALLQCTCSVPYTHATIVSWPASRKSMSQKLANYEWLK